jgi:hypothetical protein
MSCKRAKPWKKEQVGLIVGKKEKTSIGINNTQQTARS